MVAPTEKMTAWRIETRKRYLGESVGPQNLRR